VFKSRDFSKLSNLLAFIVHSQVYRAHFSAVFSNNILDPRMSSPIHLFIVQFIIKIQFLSSG